MSNKIDFFTSLTNIGMINNNQAHKLPKKGIYLLTNKINNKIYIGKSINLPKRIYNHKYGKEQIIGRAIKKHGWHNFQVSILEECDINIDNDQLLQKESEWIIKLDATHPVKGYNITTYGMDRTGIPCSIATKQKLSLANKGRFLGKDNPTFGTHHSQVTLQKMRRPRSLQGKRNISIGNQYKNLKPVNQIHPISLKIIKNWNSIHEACKNIRPNKKYSGLISMVCNKKVNHMGKQYKTAYGFRWEYS